MTASERHGITCGGIWVVDKVKNIDKFPERGLLGNILSETGYSTGGAPANVLADLSLLQAPFPLAGIGVVGNDEPGRLVQERFKALGVDVSGLVVTDDAPTSYTDVMNEEDAGVRTFFHCRGANALFGPEHVDIDSLTCRIFHLGYILLMDTLDQPDPEFGTVAARLLSGLQDAGILTSIDLVSEDSERFRQMVPPALRYVDYAIINEIEAGRVTGIAVRSGDGALDGEAVKAAVEEIAALGQASVVAVHMPEGLCLRTADGKLFSAGSVDVPRDAIKSTAGAGDAFCTGMLYGLHEGWPIEKTALLANCVAASVLAEYGCTEGVLPLEEVLELAGRYGSLPTPVTV